jgi:hypothetical protein
MLALALMLFLGVRRGDLVTLGRQHAQDDFIRIIPRKTRHKRKDVSEKPILPVLADIIARSPTGALIYLETPFSANASVAGFGQDVTKLDCSNARQWPMQGWRYYGRRERRHRSSTHGIFLIGHRRSGRMIYTVGDGGRELDR